ncbi:hypothetical protein [Nocardioides baekrokdamisoli]|nr:hypothetical protein [Nocardioides baekrokdamisoli]
MKSIALLGAAAAVLALSAAPSSADTVSDLQGQLATLQGQLAYQQCQLQNTLILEGMRVPYLFYLLPKGHICIPPG